MGAASFSRSRATRAGRGTRDRGGGGARVFVERVLSLIATWLNDTTGPVRPQAASPSRIGPAPILDGALSMSFPSMSEMHDTATRAERALLVGVQTDKVSKDNE